MFDLMISYRVTLSNKQNNDDTFSIYVCVKVLRKTKSNISLISACRLFDETLLNC